MVRRIRIGLIGDFDPAVTAHQAIPRALQLAADRAKTRVEPVWVSTASVGKDGVPLQGFAGLWCVPASPYASLEGAVFAIRFAREEKRPFLGTCGGFQHALLEYARNVLGFARAGHAECDPETALPLIAPLACALVERSGRIRLTEGSRIRAIYGVGETEEEYHCSYGLNPQYERMMVEDGRLRVSGRDGAGEVRAVELIGHPFFIATLYQPERAALRGRSHPLVEAFVGAAAGAESARPQP